jgi:drug/metabolite transporter (DMT)-like permease
MNNIYIIFPFLSAALYGLGYVLIERLLKHVPIATFTFFSAITLGIICGLVGFLRKDSFSLDFLSDKKIAWLFVFTIVANAGGWIVTQMALKHTSAEFVSFAELTYPLFTLFFLFVLFNQSQFNWQSLFGGALVMIGAAILVMGQGAKS